MKLIKRLGKYALMATLGLAGCWDFSNNEQTRAARQLPLEQSYITASVDIGKDGRKDKLVVGKLKDKCALYLLENTEDGFNTRKLAEVPRDPKVLEEKLRNVNGTEISFNIDNGLEVPGMNTLQLEVDGKVYRKSFKIRN